MKRLLLAALLAASPFTFAADSAAPAAAPSAAEPYAPGPDAERRPGVPAGKVIGPLTWESPKAYPGTWREYWIYVPAQYNPLKPAALMVFQDGLQYLREDGHVRAAIVMDNLIHRGEMPVAIGVFINPGYFDHEPPPDAKNWNTRNRPIEYDTVSNAYAKFLTDEFMPGAMKRYNITKNAAGHAIVGASSGGIAAFTAAWTRPDYFQKVISHIGSFIDIRGGHVYPEKVRASARRPIRFALQDGAANRIEENRPPDRNPIVQNKRLVEALREKNYDVRFDFGTGGHSLRHGGAIFADQLRWLWRDYSDAAAAAFADGAPMDPPPPADAPFGTPGTEWELQFGGMSSPVTYEFRPNGVLWWVEYQLGDNYEFKDGELLTTSPSDPAGRFRTWSIKGNTFARTIHGDNDVELGLVARGTLKRIK